MFLFRSSLVILLLTKILCASFVNIRSENESKIPAFINRLTSDLNFENSVTHDVAVLQCSGFKKSNFHVDDTFSEIVQRVGSDNPVTIPSLRERAKQMHIRGASFIIMVTDLYDPVSMEE